MSPEITEAYQGPNRVEKRTDYPQDGTNPEVALDNEAKAKAEAYQGDIEPGDMIVSPQSKPDIDEEQRRIGFEGDTRVIAANASADTWETGTETPDRPTPPTNVTSEAQQVHPGTPPTPPELPYDAGEAEFLPDEPVDPETEPEGHQPSPPDPQAVQQTAQE